MQAPVLRDRRRGVAARGGSAGLANSLERKVLEVPCITTIKLGEIDMRHDSVFRVIRLRIAAAAILAGMPGAGAQEIFSAATPPSGVAGRNTAGKTRRCSSP